MIFKPIFQGLVIKPFRQESGEPIPRRGIRRTECVRVLVISSHLSACAASVGTIAFKVAKVNAQTGEIAGVFESIQPSDTDLGAKVPKDVKTSGVWYGQISPA